MCKACVALLEVYFPEEFVAVCYISTNSMATWLLQYGYLPHNKYEDSQKL